MSAVLIAAFCVMEIGHLGWTATSVALCVARIGWAGAALGFCARAGAMGPRAIDRGLAVLALVAVLIVLASDATRPAGFQPHALTNAGVVMALYLLLPLRFAAAAAIAATLTAGYLALASRGGALSPVELVTVIGGFLVAHGIGIHGHAWLARMARSEFLRVRAAEEAHAERLAFLAATSHELRTPLHGIVACAELLAGTDLAPEQRELVSLIRSSIAGMAGLLDEAVRQVRGGAELPSIEPAVIDLHAFLDDLAAFVRARAATHGIAVSLRRSDRVPRSVHADAARVRQVLLNLAENALAHGARAEIVLEADATPPRADGRVPIELGVLDDGPGVPREEREAILRPFVQGGAHGYGMGLGLAICDRIARAMEGRIEIDDAPAGGARFRLCVPLVDAGATEPAARPAARVGHAPLSLLLVEDEAVGRRLMTLLLERDGHRVVVATSGEQALEQIAVHRFDAVLLDLRLPGMDGVETARQITARSALHGGGPALIAMSAHVALADHEELRSRGFRAIVAKPVELTRLRAALGALAASAVELPVLGDEPPSDVEPPLCDEAALGAHRNALGAATVARLLGLFVESTGPVVDALGLAAHAGKHDDVATLAHRIAGAAGSAALARCAHLAAAVEASARRREAVPAERIQALRRVHEASCAEATRRAGELLAERSVSKSGTRLKAPRRSADRAASHPS